MDELKTETGVLKLFYKLAQALTDNNNSDVSTPPHFSGKDDGKPGTAMYPHRAFFLMNVFCADFEFLL
jgi:hypothetical protein